MNTTSRQPTTLESALAGALLSIVRWIESLPDDELDPDTAVKMLEDVAGVVDELAPDDQQTFIRAVHDLAQRRPDDWDAAAIERMLVGLNLIEPSGDWDEADRDAPPSPPPLPPDLDERVASIHSALERYMNPNAGESTAIGKRNPRGSGFVRAVRRLFKSDETPDA